MTQSMLETLGFPDSRRQSDSSLVKSHETIEQAARRLSNGRININECAGPAKRFLKGAYYQPITWWIGNLNSLAMTGLFGREKDRHSSILHSQLAQILWVANTNMETRRLAFKALQYHIDNNRAGAAGRIAGGLFTNYASRGGAFGKRTLSKKVKVSSDIANFVIASYGAGILGVSRGMQNIDKIVSMIISGDLALTTCLPPMGNVPFDLGRMERDPRFQTYLGLLGATHSFVIDGWDIFE